MAPTGGGSGTTGSDARWLRAIAARSRAVGPTSAYCDASSETGAVRSTPAEVADSLTSMRLAQKSLPPPPLSAAGAGAALSSSRSRSSFAIFCRAPILETPRDLRSSSSGFCPSRSRRRATQPGQMMQGPVFGEVGNQAEQIDHAGMDIAASATIGSARGLGVVALAASERARSCVASVQPRSGTCSPTLVLIFQFTCNMLAHFASSRFNSF